MRKARAQIVSFPLLNTVSSGANRISGLSFSAGNSKVSKDGGSFVNTTNLPVEILTTGRYSLSLTASEMNANHIHLIIQPVGADPYDTMYVTGGQPTGAVVANGSNTGATFQTSLSDTVTDTWKDAYCLFTTGVLTGQVKKLGGFNGSTKFLSVIAGSAYTAAPSNGDIFLLIDV